MLPIADTHVHLLPGLDDGPGTIAEALAMARMLVSQGVRHATALAHQNPSYPANTAIHLRTAADLLAIELAKNSIPLSVYPTGEVMIAVETFTQWKEGVILTIGGHGRAVLLEMPHDQFYDIRPLARELRAGGVRPVIAHAERYPELLFDAKCVNDFLEVGCLIQVTAGELSDPRSPHHEKALKDWVKRGIVHLLGTDGHNLTTRQPLMRDGLETLARWAGPAAADRIGGIWGTALLQGKPINPPAPLPPARNWFARLVGG